MFTFTLCSNHTQFSMCCSQYNIIYKTFGFFVLCKIRMAKENVFVSRSVIHLKQCLPAGPQTLQQKVCAYWNPYFLIILYSSIIFTIGAHKKFPLSGNKATGRGRTGDYLWTAKVRRMQTSYTIPTVLSPFFQCTWLFS